MATISKFNSRIQLQIYELAKTGVRPYAIARSLDLDLQSVKQCIKSMNLPAKSEIKAPNPKEIYDYLNSTAVNISRQEAERRTIVRFKINYQTFNLFYNKWRSDYMVEGLD